MGGCCQTSICNLHWKKKWAKLYSLLASFRVISCDWVVITERNVTLKFDRWRQLSFAMHIDHNPEMKGCMECLGMHNASFLCNISMLSLRCMYMEEWRHVVTCQKMKVRFNTMNTILGTMASVWFINRFVKWWQMLLFEPIWCWYRCIPSEVDQYHCCWWPGSLPRQVIISHGIDYVGLTGNWLPRRRIPTARPIFVCDEW